MTLSDGTFQMGGLRPVPHPVFARSEIGAFALCTGVTPGDKEGVLTLGPGGRLTIQFRSSQLLFRLGLHSSFARSRSSTPTPKISVRRGLGFYFSRHSCLIDDRRIEIHVLAGCLNRHDEVVRGDGIPSVQVRPLTPPAGDRVDADEARACQLGGGAGPGV